MIMTDCYFKWSKNKDGAEITELLNLCFGERDMFVFDDYNGKFLMAVDKKTNRIIAVSGLSWIETYTGHYPEIYFSCTHPDYRRLGIMHELFRRLLNTTDEDIYCCCWRIANKDKPNLYSVLKSFEFELVKENICHCTKGRLGADEDCDDSIMNCPYYFDKNCECFDDLYVRRSVYNE